MKSFKVHVLIILLCLLLGYLIVSNVYVHTDEITLTTLGERNPVSQGDDVAVLGFSVGPKQYGIEVASGKWFWRGEDYMWRAEEDNRRPPDLTRSVTFKVPAGYFRGMTCVRSPNSGLVSVDFEGQYMLLDLFHEVELVSFLGLPDSSPSTIMAGRIKTLLMGLSLGVILALAAIAIRRLWQKRHEKIINWISENRYTVIMAGITIAYFFCMLAYGGIQKLWYDEVAQIGISNRSFSDMMRVYVTMQEPSPPLYGIAAHFWYALISYNQTMLMLLSIIPTALSVFVLGMAAQKQGGGRLGVTAVLLAATSSEIACEVGLELRMYSFAILASALLLYCYVARFNDNNGPSSKNIIAAGICMALLVYSHYLAVLVCLGLFLFDIVLYAKRKVPRRVFYAYIIGGVLFLPWALAVVFNIERDISSFWPARPLLRHILDYMLALLDIQMFRLALLCLGITAVFAGLRQATRQRLPLIAAALLPWFMILVLYIYSAHINPQGSLFVKRYFYCLLPWILLVSAYGVMWLIQMFAARKKQVWVAACIFLALFLGMQFTIETSFNANTTKEKVDYRLLAEFLLKQDDIYSPDSVVYLHGGGGPIDPSLTLGWQDYFVTQKGRRDPINALAPDQLLLIADYSKVYLAHIRGTDTFSPQWFRYIERKITEAGFTLTSEALNGNLKIYTK